MLLSVDTVIAEEKLTKYLLVLLPKDDKSQFLQKAGYTLENWQQFLSILVIGSNYYET